MPMKPQSFAQVARWAEGWNVVRSKGPATRVPNEYKTPSVAFAQFTGASARPMAPGEEGWADNGVPLLMLDHWVEGKSICVVDIDDLSQLDTVTTFLAARDVDLASTFSVSTGREGGGRQFYFLREPGVELAYESQNSAHAFSAKAVDLKATRAYVAAPGALHKSGRVYEGSRSGDLADLVEGGALATMPLAVWRDMRARNGARVAARHDAPDAVTFELAASDPYWSEVLSAATGRSADANGEIRMACPRCGGNDRKLRYFPAEGRTWCNEEEVNRRLKGCNGGSSYSQSPAGTVTTFKPPVGISLPLPAGERYLWPVAAVPSCPVEVWQAGQGVGKTTQAAARVSAAKARGERVVSISPLKSLVATAASKFGLPHYGATKGKIDTSVGICAPSLHRLVIVHITEDGLPEEWPVDLLVIDEIEQTLQQLRSREIYTPLEARHTYVTLVSIVRSARAVLLMDADAGALTAQLIQDAGRGQETAWRVGPAAPARIFEWVSSGRAGHVLEIAEAVANGGNEAVACMSREVAEDVFAQLCRRCPDRKGLLITPDTIADVDLTDPKTFSTLNFLVYSPAMATGVSIDIERHFDQIHLLEAKTGDARMALQMVHRVRSPKSVTVRVSGARHTMPAAVEMDPEMVRRRYLLAASHTAANVKKRGLEVPADLWGSADAQMFFKLSCLSEADAVRNGAGWVCRYLMDDRIDVKTIPRPEATEAAKERKAIREERHSAIAQEIAAIDPATLYGVDDDFDGDLSDATEQALRLARTFGPAYELAPETRRASIAVQDLSGKKTRQARTLADVMAASSEEGRLALARTDAKDLADATPDRLRHLSLKADVRLALLKQLGLDEALGLRSTVTTFEPATLNPLKVQKAALFAHKHREALNAVGIKVERDVVDQPTTFASTLLRSLGIGLNSRQHRVNGRHVRTYTVDMESVAEMRDLAAAPLDRVLSGRRERDENPGALAARSASEATQARVDEMVAELLAA